MKVLLDKVKAAFRREETEPGPGES
jgi:hypothetical protein